MSYAPPYARIAGLIISTWSKLESPELTDDRTKALMQEAIEFARKALDASKSSVGENKYAPALLDLAYAKFNLAYAQHDGNALEKARNELEAAIRCAPFDRITWENYESFMNTIRKDVSGPEAYTNYLHSRLFRPTDAITTRLKNAIVMPNTTHASEGNTNSLIVLKRWSSYSPILISGRPGRTYGGGYLINWEGKWIAIDPGVGFIELMYSRGVTIRDLDVVAVTHDDTDHQQEMQALLALFGEFNNRVSTDSDDKRDLHFLFSQSSWERWPKKRFPREFTKRIPQIHRLNPRVEGEKEVNLFGGLINVVATPTNGHFDIGDRQKKRDQGTQGTGVGLVFQLRKKTSSRNPDCVLGVTGDTAYCDVNGSNIVSQYFEKCNVILAHVSTVDDLDPAKGSKLIKPRYRKDRVKGFKTCYKKHLGFWGTVGFIDDIRRHNPSAVVLLSEFGEEFLPIRDPLWQEINAIFREMSGQSSLNACYPTDIGTRVSLVSGQIMCQFGTMCPQPSCDEETGMPRPFEIVNNEIDPTVSHQGWRDRRLVYVCADHRWATDNPDYYELL